MSFSELVAELELSLRTTHTAISELLAALQARRASWLSMRPSTLAPSPEIERLTRDLAREEDRRAALLPLIRAALPAPAGADPAALHLNVTRIAAALPRDEGRRLRGAADAVTGLAKQVRAEVTLGQRLLRFAHGADAGLAGLLPNAKGDAGGYDRQARTVVSKAAAGHWVDGRI